ncbi:MAG: 30S ribosomal protein S12 methylthiotransferase RimO [Clostridia bacterium]|nr:30S ribosomal protein S12 methylthiotransferase RimO [Clostridia bacterium]
MSTVGVISLGCAKNRVDTERMLAYLADAGHIIVSDPSEAEVLIVNTCGFIESAKQESIDTILEMAQYKKHGVCEKLVMTGCLSQRYRTELKEALPEVDLMLGTGEYALLPDLLKGAEKPGCAPDAGRVLTTPSYSAFLRIGDGCNNRCTYCAIPLIRGPLTSDPIEKLVSEARALAANGVTELTVIAQDTSGYGRDLYGKPQLIELLGELEKIDPLKWIRVLYTYPDTVTEELIDAFRGNEKIVNYLDMPLQHINDDILRRMNRRGSKRHIEKVLDYLRNTGDDFTLRTTMMLGFPGETDEQFEELLQFLREHPFDRVGAFTFSPEEGTKAAEMPDQVPEEVKQERLERLMLQQQEISKQRNEARIGTVTEVLIEGTDEDGLFGRTRAEAPDDVDGLVRMPYAKAKAGEYRKVRLTGATEYDMMGELVE